MYLSSFVCLLLLLFFYSKETFNLSKTGEHNYTCTGLDIPLRLVVDDCNVSGNIFQWIIDGRAIQYSLLHNLTNQTCQTDDYAIQFINFKTDGNTANITSVWTPCSSAAFEIALQCGSKLYLREVNNISKYLN